MTYGARKQVMNAKQGISRTTFSMLSYLIRSLKVEDIASLTFFFHKIARRDSFVFHTIIQVPLSPHEIT